MSLPPDVPADAASRGDGRGLIGFLNFAAERGEMTVSSAMALRTGCLRVVEATESADADMRQVDVEALLQRYENLKRTSVKGDTLRAYSQRFRQSVEMYRKFLAGQEWRPGKRPARATARTTAINAPAEVAGAVEAVPAGVSIPRLVEYPFPVRSGVLARLHLPADLTPTEAARVAGFVQALAFEPAADGVAALS